ncbi:hypothetical protein B9Z55_029068 [Caenorhabditis nigoni]|uniref:Glutamate synthase alpha subunit C-terminal domain-containing protein n=1 Tax=Caenorhabditis nigoni TaxID=1611254 RepID=A0A2G5S983_9PELO|nr:hypothetical protein B9Z55_029068 [Caenorhabditis nigoni]
MLVPRRCPCTIRCQQCWSKCVVDAVGDQVCEYKTGGKIIMLGTTGRNFAAALNGEIACFCAQENNFYSLINAATVDLNDATTVGPSLHSFKNREICQTHWLAAWTTNLH